MSGDYQLCGWRVRSDLPLPELLPWTGLAEAEIDVHIGIGNVPDRLEAQVNPSKLVMISPDGSVLLMIPDLVRILVQGGNQITVQHLDGGLNEGWRLYLLSSAFGYLCHQRGLFPLHAACLNIGGKVFAIAGASGCGKSTLALALVRRGHKLLSDDVTVLGSGPDEKSTFVLPAYPRLKLWRDSLEAQSLSADSFARVREDMDKFDLCPKDGFDGAPLPIDGLLFLKTGMIQEVIPLDPMKAAVLLNHNVFRASVAMYMGRRQGLFSQSVGIAAATPAYRLVRSKDFSGLTDLVALVEGLNRAFVGLTG